MAEGGSDRLDLLLRRVGPVLFETFADGGVLTPVTSGEVPRIASGAALASFEITVGLADVGTDGFVIRLDDDARVEESVPRGTTSSRTASPCALDELRRDVSRRGVVEP